MPSGSKPSGHVHSTPDETSLPQRNRRRRGSGRPTLTEQPEASSNALATARRTLTRNSPQRGSARAMTPPEGDVPVKLTRTGRVSKATKGQRIHHCDECGKTYTRAEHLRRHQQNHKAGAFPCDVPGCGRSFYREDLLIRHKVRHDDPYASPSRQGSPDSQASAPAGPLSDHTIPSRRARSQRTSVDDNDGETMEALPPSTHTVEHQDSDDMRTKDRYLNLLQLPLNQPIPTNPVSWTTDSAFGQFQQWDPSPPYSPAAAGYESPNQNGYHAASLPYFQEHVPQVRHDSTASFYDIQPSHATSRSPVSAGSSTIQLPQWSCSMPNAVYQTVSAPVCPQQLYDSEYGLYNGSNVLLSTYGSGAWTPEERDFMEQSELIVPVATPKSMSLDLSFDESTTSNEDTYLSAYWTWVHPFFTIIHRPSFNLLGTSPLLKAAILALGAQACDTSTDKKNGRIIHERCVKVLQKRTLNEWHSFRTCDMQAIVLIEIYSVFRSRRQPFQLSGIFTQVYNHLANDHVALGSPHHNGVAGGEFGAENISDILTTETSCKRRLLMACYILDVQHTILFGRLRQTCFTGSGADLPFPEAQIVWDARALQHVTRQDVHSTVWDALENGRNNAESYDIFQTTVVSATLMHSFSAVGGVPALRDDACEALYAMFEQSPRSRMTYHIGKLCKVAPIRALLAVAGESWVMGEKLSAQSDYADAQALVRQWAEAPSSDSIGVPVQKALWQALKILELHQTQPKSGLLFQEWSIYLASLVIWARAYVSSDGSQKKPRLSIPQPSEPRLSTVELDKSVAAIVSAGNTETISKDQAKTILLWTKAKIERVDIPHNCGLTNGALDVLGKLITRGNEAGWLGL